MILERAAAEIEADKAKKDAMKVKSQIQKLDADQMLKEAKRKRDTLYQGERAKEHGEVAKLRAGIEKEKEDKVSKKAKERENAWKVIRENEQEKVKRMQEKEEERLKQIQLIDDYNKTLDVQDKKRADEFAAREARIQNAMGRMADTVLKKSNEAEKELERRVIMHASQADKKAEERALAKKEAIRQRDL